MWRTRGAFRQSEKQALAEPAASWPRNACSVGLHELDCPCFQISSLLHAAIIASCNVPTVCAGVPYALSGAIYILLFSRWFLAGEDSKRHGDLFFAARAVQASAVLKDTVYDAGLMRMERLSLVAVERRVRENVSDMKL